MSGGLDSFDGHAAAQLAAHLLIRSKFPNLTKYFKNLCRARAVEGRFMRGETRQEDGKRLCLQGNKPVFLRVEPPARRLLSAVEKSKKKSGEVR